VLESVAQGLSNTTIAERLVLSDRTVEAGHTGRDKSCATCREHQRTHGVRSMGVVKGCNRESGDEGGGA
jgi:FixJ family two-component response regulator